MEMSPGKRVKWPRKPNYYWAHMERDCIPDRASWSIPIMGKQDKELYENLTSNLGLCMNMMGKTGHSFVGINLSKSPDQVVFGEIKTLKQIQYGLQVGITSHYWLVSGIHIRVGVFTDCRRQVTVTMVHMDGIPNGPEFET